jgi:hypothetical protein
MKTRDLTERLDAFLRVDEYPPDGFAEITSSAGRRTSLWSATRRRTSCAATTVSLPNANDVERVFTLVFHPMKCWVMSNDARRAAGANLHAPPWT